MLGHHKKQRACCSDPMSFLAFTGLTLGTAIISGAFFAVIVLMVGYLETHR